VDATERNGFETAYDEAFRLACAELLDGDMRSCCRHAGACLREGCAEGHSIELDFLNKKVRIALPGFEFSPEIDIWEKILVAHYLVRSASGAPLAGTLINYKQVQDGAVYFPAFEKRSIKPLLGAFGADPQLLPAAAGGLGGVRAEYGDVGVKIMAFARVPLYFVLWYGDDEFPADASILFDASIGTRLSAEDIAVLCQQVVIRLVRRVRQMQPGR